MNAPNAKELACEVAPFLEQGLEFHYAGSVANLRVKPVLQYYAYLNLAVAIVLIYKPKDWEGFRAHGAEDLTRRVNKISLSTPVVRLRRGALNLFHAVISDGPLPTKDIKLRDLLIPIPMIAGELENVFQVSTKRLEVSGTIRSVTEGGKNWVGSFFDLSTQEPGQPAATEHKFPLKRVYRAMPLLRTMYRPMTRSGPVRTFASVRKWSVENQDRAQLEHDVVALKIVNFGGQTIQPQGDPSFGWKLDGKSPLMPTISAGLILSFVLSSLSRYRANVLDRVENSSINLLCDVFASEADGFMIPAMRNLLYSETMYISAVSHT